ncbi:hypothetical protein Tco_0817942 [Tanacetum coccineum]
MEQYVALIPDNIKPGIMNPKIGDDIEFEINANLMRELRRKLFTCTDNEDAYEHVRTVLEIVDLFHFPGVTHDAIMLRKLDEIRNFKQERDKTLYHAWERYNVLLYQYPLHDLNCQQKVHIFYSGLDISTRKILDSNGFIPLMTTTQALELIQVMADHLHDWYDETTIRERIKDVLDNVDAIHESFKGEHLTKEYPLKKEDEVIKHGRYMESLEETIIKFCKDTIKKQTANDERMMKILKNTKLNIRALRTRAKNLQEKAYQLTYKVLTNTGEKIKAIMTMGKENMKEPVPHDLPPTLFPGHLKEQMGSPYKTRETIRMNGNPEEIHNVKAQDDEGDMDVVQPYIPLGPVHDMDKIVKEKEHDYDILLNDNVMQALTPQTVHITPPGDDYVALAINPMSNKQLNKFEEECSNITKVVEKEYDNPVIKTYDCETFIRKLLPQVSQSLREMKSQQLYGSNLSFPYQVANHGVHCYSHSHLILSEGRNTLLLGK